MNAGIIVVWDSLSYSCLKTDTPRSVSITFSRVFDSNMALVAEFIVSLESAYISRLAGSGDLDFALRTNSSWVPNNMNVPASPTM